MELKPISLEQKEQGFVPCSCGKFVHIFKAELLKKLPKDYHGELCPDCNLFMVRKDKLLP